MSIYKKGDKTVVLVESSEIATLIAQAKDQIERRKLLRNYLKNKIVGKALFKVFENRRFDIKNTNSDTKHLTHNEHLDTSLALTQVEELIEASELIGEKEVNLEKTTRSPNSYFWYFKVSVEFNNASHDYTLNIGKSKSDGHISLYEINNYNKKER